VRGQYGKFQSTPMNESLKLGKNVLIITVQVALFVVSILAELLGNWEKVSFMFIIYDPFQRLQKSMKLIL